MVSDMQRSSINCMFPINKLDNNFHYLLSSWALILIYAPLRMISAQKRKTFSISSIDIPLLSSSSVPSSTPWLMLSQIYQNFSSSSSSFSTNFSLPPSVMMINTFWYSLRPEQTISIVSGNVVTLFWFSLLPSCLFDWYFLMIRNIVISSQS